MPLLDWKQCSEAQRVEFNRYEDERARWDAIARIAMLGEGIAPIQSLASFDQWRDLLGKLDAVVAFHDCIASLFEHGPFYYVTDADFDADRNLRPEVKARTRSLPDNPNDSWVAPVKREFRELLGRLNLPLDSDLDYCRGVFARYLDDQKPKHIPAPSSDNPQKTITIIMPQLPAGAVPMKYTPPPPDIAGPARDLSAALDDYERSQVEYERHWRRYSHAEREAYILRQLQAFDPISNLVQSLSKAIRASGMSDTKKRETLNAIGVITVTYSGAIDPDSIGDYCRIEPESLQSLRKVCDDLRPPQANAPAGPGVTGTRGYLSDTPKRGRPRGEVKASRDRIIDRELEVNPNQTDEEIAKTANCDRATVNRRRNAKYKKLPKPCGGVQSLDAMGYEPETRESF